MIAEQKRSAWVTPLHWDGSSWSYSWGSLEELEWARRREPNRAEAFAGRASLMQRLLKQNDKVIALSDGTSVLVYRRIESLDCVVVASYPLILASGPCEEPRVASHA